MKHSAQLLALSALLVAFQPSQGKDESKPIVDVRFDGPYQQVESSTGDEWAPTWGRDDVLYTGNDDGASFGNVPTNAIAFGKLEGGDPNKLKGVTVNGMSDYQESHPNSAGLGPDGANWKTMNSYSIDGVLYMFVTRCAYPSGSSDPQHRHIFQNSSIIKSTDNGRTWTRSARENFNHPMFPGKRFGAPYFVWYGKDGAAGVDNADQYVYAVSNNGHFENGDDYVLGRVPRSKLSHLSAADWSFYKGGDGMRENGWTTQLSEARPVLAHPGKSSMTGMTYIEGLHRYMMAVWHYHRANFEEGIREKDLGTVIEFFEAPKPWGPWNAVKSFDTGKLGWYTPIIGQRFQATVDSSTVKAVFYATGFLTKPDGTLDMALYKLNYMPITLSTQPLQHPDSAYIGGR